MVFSNQLSVTETHYLLQGLYYLLGIKQKFFTTFYPHTNGQTERQNSIIKVHLYAYINCEQNNSVRLLPMAEFANNNAKNLSTGHTFFNLKCSYHLCLFFEDEVDPCSRSHSTNKLVEELKKLMSICQQNLLHAQEL